MFSIKRNQVIVTALVIMIAVAGYLNIVDSNKTAKENEEALTYGELPDGTLVPNEELLEVSSPNVEGDIGIAVSSDEDLSMYATEFEDVDMETGIVDDLAVESAAEEETPGQAIFVNSNSSTEYDKQFFVSAKLEREQTRAKEKDMLTEMIGNENLAKEDISECTTALLSIQKRIEKEASAEAMIEAKGFKEVYVRIDDQTVDVIVSKASLTEAEVAQIEDIVTRKTGFETDKIKISTLKSVG